MEIPVLTRQVAEVVTETNIPLLRQFDIPPEFEAEPSPKPDELDQGELIPEDLPDENAQDYDEKTIDGINYIAFKGHWYPTGENVHEKYKWEWDDEIGFNNYPYEVTLNGIKYVASNGRWLST
jgi:hypothetical protein